ncbi:hypothetical protein N7466_000098 [Penicillium verhagenii]|uniref:uncharacterized protein n=1 Tax=Penicillium verhagenii TaxID=1562060 RepID=UPI0025452A19|nr:uncharacterized protein N7466_000098 [Penicillium verhagenii]KAJ5947083.1 hypothetical protein N7466_000098 [Penicillium verhagenii]
MPYSLPGRNVLVIGGSRGIGAIIAKKFAAEGSNVAINYMSSKETAEKVAGDLAGKYNVKTVVIQGDAGKQSEATNTVKSAIEQLGGLDVVISNAGWTKMTNFGDLDAMDDDDWDKCWNINVKSSFYLFKAAKPTFDANPEGGAFIITASTAGIVPSGSSVPYAVTKAAVIHLMKCLAQTQGPKVRVNAVCPGLMLTEWVCILVFEDSRITFLTISQGQQFTQEKIKAMTDKMTLNKLPEVEDAAEMYLSIAKNSSMTGAAVQIGMNPDILKLGCG